MPELPEVETTARGIAPHLQGRRIERVRVHEPRLRWRVDARLADWTRGQQVLGVNGGVSAANVAVTAGAGATLTSSTFDFGTLALRVGGPTLVSKAAGDLALGTLFECQRRGLPSASMNGRTSPMQMTSRPVMMVEKNASTTVSDSGERITE